MTEIKSAHKPRRGRIFPEIQWTEEKKAQWRSERETFRQRCQVIFEQVKSDFIKTNYNWYIAVEPNSGEYFVAEDELLAITMSRQKYPYSPVYVFRLNETGVAGTI